LIRKASLLFCAAVLACTLPAAHGQADVPQSAFSRVLSRIDLGILGAGEFTQTVSGPIIPHEAPDYGATVTQQVSNTLGAVVSLHYQQKPWLGAEFNGTYARYTENYVSAPPYQVQTRASEYSVGYVAQPAFTLLGLSPYFGGGGGGMEFKPTGHGGQGQETEARPMFYYSVGVQKDINSFLGLRGGLRQEFFEAPDYNANYLTLQKRTSTLQPAVGFYIRF
jgi:opacity protein-like surface antigen